LYLKKLEILGFKSFADKTFIDFDSGMTAIVGPNGCGKTNIVDAVRWVIGEQKASVLRSSTMENVIFNGTNSRKPLGVAEVSLTIENTKGILPSEYSEITLTRRCFRDGQSNYLLNGTICRLKDITSLFMDTGMGADAYSVIELKMVNEILSPRTQDRRKLFEEAAGITKYKERRREALYKLEIARENLQEANIEIRNRQRTVVSYEKIAQRRQEANEISEQLRELEIDYHQRCYSKLVNDTKDVEAELKSKELEREQLQEKYNEREKITDEIKKRLRDTESSLNQVRDALNSVISRISGIQNAITMAEQKINYLNDNIERFRSEKVEIENRIDKLEKQKSDLEEKIKVVINTSVLLEESLASKRKNLDEIDEKVKNSKEELKDLASKHNAVAKLLTEKQNEYEITKSRLDSQISRCERITDENITNINKVSAIEEEKGIFEKQLTETRDLYLKLKLEYEEKYKEREEFASEIARLERDILYKTHELEKLDDKIKLQMNLLENYEDYSEGVRYLVGEADEKEAETVIQKIEVEDKFKIAIETALGEISNYLVVSNRQAAEKLINVLKEKEKGKVTFILKDELFKQTLNIFQEEFRDILMHEGVYGWADKFVKCPAEYYLLYRYLLDEYIIVENIDTALKLSHDNFIKFITLDGDIVTQGFIRSGSRTIVESIKIGREKLIKELNSQIKELSVSIGKDKSAVNDVRSKFDSIKIEEKYQTLDSLKAKLRELEANINQLEYQKQQINTLIDNNNSELNSLNKQNKELSDKIDRLITELETAENNKYQREKELEHFTSELETLADELTVKKDEYNNFNIEITKIKGEHLNLENELKRCRESIESGKSTIVLRTQESENYRKQIEELLHTIEVRDESGELIGGNRLKLKELEHEKEIAETDFTHVKAEYDANRQLIDAIEFEQRELHAERDKIIDFIHRNELQITKDRIEMKEHIDKMMEEYGFKIQYQYYEDEQSFDYVKTRNEIEKLKIKLKQLGGSGQLELGIYEEEKKELERMIGIREDLIKAEEDLMNLIEYINKTAQEKFTQTFELIRSNFQGIFRELFMEGDEADIKLNYDPDNPDPLEAKIDIIAKPRGKRPQLIDLLSGGEKTLTAIALLFAIYQVKPSPFCILDEVDAPLDDANIDRFIKIIRKFSDDTQFIIVTHNKRTMEAADSMYGVTMAEQGISTIVNVKFNDQPVSS
jgi:chromosome segregation protein